MKLSIESQVYDLGYSVIVEFTKICNAIVKSNSESELRNNMKSVECRYFTYGFGSSHMWVKHKADHRIETSERLIFVEYE